ncbi:crotonobetainyl-CoA:carnitine CoA-transferase CaiB-like acyl-CoA transferase [Actinokineospora baliensis]|uniref:CoA transferase n=1 Tax=Actinokineospora baliensis TaxID=547056 RepID=UPI001958F56A|nr:CoA transferase [Actinokineospora baliensis]MBM7775198.1 crotonobetainyl-CoA:carnitine CoA-transferase CaiB-like acyl-CoA transferase [Actinokineospora baliensis]
MGGVVGGLPEGVSWAGPVDLPLAGEIDVQAACGVMHVHGRRFGGPRRLDLNYTCIVASELGETGAAAVRVGRARGMALRGMSTSAAQAGLLAVSRYLAAATGGGGEDIPGPGGAPLVSVEGVGYEVEAVDAVVWRRFWAALGADAGAVAAGWPLFARRTQTAACPLPAELGRVAARTSIGVTERCARDTGMAVVRVAHPPIDDLAPYSARPLEAVGADLPPAGPLPLSGLRVVECCRRDHGMMAGHLLGFLGATVVRVVPDRHADSTAVLNRGKRVVAADPATVAGRRVLRDLVAAADVFTHDWPPDKARAWSLDAAGVSGVRPGIVHAHATDWGSALGRWPPPGTDPVVQAYAGVPPTLLPVVAVFAGVVLTRAVTTALEGRVEHGRGHRVESSLAAAAARLNARRGACTAPLSVPVCTDLAELADDPRFAKALTRDGCVVPVSPWTFH